MSAGALSLRTWLTSDAPSTRAQARAIKYAGLARRVLRRRLAWFGLLPLATIVALALLAPILPLPDPLAQDLQARLQSFSAQHWLGTDALGRDMLSRLIFGGRPSLSIVLFVLLSSAPVGVLLGAFAGLVGGWLDGAILRIGDVFLAFPRLVLALAIAAAMGAGISTAIFAIALTGWPTYARLARAEARVYRGADFVQAAEALGASRFRILTRHILPLCLPSAIVRAALDAPGVILITAGLGFLGLGAPPPLAEWGAMVANGRDVIFEQWWVATLPGLCIFAISLSFNLIGDALRDAIDPRAA